ncbi:PREDICTED: receptor like protein kinase S.3 [Tarenaya hassleriana]|uniref:receptor like protein kinase S.3 n=1 Tax=Tarenaya hassleriana TaxID=28532 RepID=UPI00053C2628|nr:PREDICTED: receptor like protein kinase S.3 [Tarenaya hassleriana]
MGAAFRSLYGKTKYEEVQEEWEEDYGPQRFSYKALYKATKGFKDSEVVRTEANGMVYRGKLSSNAQIAVKRVSLDMDQETKHIVSQIVGIGKLRHKNLVQLLGYCRRKGELLLVYDYMPYGNLDDFLFNGEKPNLSWSKRFHIIKGVASALLYLHDQVFLHRDVKAANVLLDEDLNGRLDFGLSRFGTNRNHVLGSVGYVAPELIITGMPMTKADVYAFGALLLEVACGRMFIESPGKPEEFNLVSWVCQCWKRGNLIGARDARLVGDYVQDEMEIVLKLGLICLQYNPEDRPSMSQVVKYLEGHDVLPEIPPDTPGIGIPTPYNEVLANPV